MRIDIRGIVGNPALQERVTGELQALVSRLGLRPVEGQAAFTDGNGPKGGTNIRCGLTVRLPRRPAIHAEHVAETARLAFDAAVAALERRLSRDQGRGRELRRRPKKYFVAKTLLEGDSPAGGQRRQASGYAMELKARLSQLAKLTSPGDPVVSVYLDTRWADEHQRDRVRLFEGFTGPGRLCLGCGTLDIGATGACPACGGETRTTELGEAIVDRVIAAGGGVDMVPAHEGLARAGGVAALLRYPLALTRVA